MNRSLIRAFWTQVVLLPPPTADFTGKTVIITGANRCLGFEAAHHLVKLNARRVILGCRDLAKGLQSQEKIEQATSRLGVLEVWELDLATFSSVQTFCRRAAKLERLDIVIANAALMSAQFGRFEGYERQVTVNVISTWLMALMLLPVLKQTNRAFYRQRSEDNEDLPHLTVVSSNAHFYTPFTCRKQDLIIERMRENANMMWRYHDTKLVSLLFALAVADRMRASSGKGKEINVVLNTVDPGYCQSDLMRDGPYPFIVNLILSVLYWVLARTAEMGSRTYVAAVTAGVESHGLYLEDCGLSTPSAFVTSIEGQAAQQRVFVELANILESIEPGIMEVLE